MAEKAEEPVTAKTSNEEGAIKSPASVSATATAEELKGILKKMKDLFKGSDESIKAVVDEVSQIFSYDGFDPRHTLVYLSRAEKNTNVFRKDMLKCIYLFLERGTKISSIRGRMSDEGKQVMDQLVLKYSIKETGRDKKIITLSRIAACLPWLTCKVMKYVSSPTVSLELLNDLIREQAMKNKTIRQNYNMKTKREMAQEREKQRKDHEKLMTEAKKTDPNFISTEFVFTEPEEEPLDYPHEMTCAAFGSLIPKGKVYTETLIKAHKLHQFHLAKIINNKGLMENSNFSTAIKTIDTYVDAAVNSNYIKDDFRVTYCRAFYLVGDDDVPYDAPYLAALAYDEVVKDLKIYYKSKSRKQKKKNKSQKGRRQSDDEETSESEEDDEEEDYEEIEEKEDEDKKKSKKTKGAKSGRVSKKKM